MKTDTEVFESRIKSLVDVIIKSSDRAYEVVGTTSHVHDTYTADDMDGIVNIVLGLINTEASLKPEGAYIVPRVVMLLRSLLISEDGTIALRCSVYQEMAAAEVADSPV
jgi:hypothetical protein